MELNQNSYFPIEVGSIGMARRGTKLEKGLIVALIVGSIVILGFLINTVRIEIERRSVCDSPSCILVAAQVISQVDASVDPCEDFYLFACRRAVNLTSEKHYPRNLERNKIANQLNNLLEGPIDEEDHYIFNYEKKVYQTCVADANGTQSLQTLKEIFHDLKGWPVAVGASWNESAFDWVEWTAKFRKFGLNHLQFLIYYVQGHDEDPGKRIVMIYPSYFAQSSGKERKIIKNMALMFGAAKDSVDNEVDDMLKFIAHVVKIRTEHINYTHESPAPTPIKEFQKLHKEFDWLRYINLLTEPEYTIGAEDYIKIEHGDCVKAMLDFIQKTPKRTIANYMFWRAVDDLLLIVTDRTFEMMYNDRKPRTEVCKQIITQRFSPLSSFIEYGKKYFTNESRSRANDIFNRVKREFKRLFDINKWMTEEDKQKFRYKFETMNEIIGMQHHTMNYSVYQHFFQDKLAHRETFLKMYLNLTTTMDFIRNGITTKEEWIENFMYFRYILDTQTVYFGTQNTIMVPVGALQDWYYDQDKPMYVNFATIGKNIGITFAKVITSVDVAVEAKIQWSNETKRRYEDATSCVKEKNVDIPIAKYYDYKILELGQIVGLKVAYNAYMEWVEDNGEELPPIGTGYNSRQLFWITALASSCFPDMFGFNFYIDNEPLKRNEDFAFDFMCHKNSKMNPSNKCNML